jgi:hypothetical protein
MTAEIGIVERIEPDGKVIVRWKTYGKGDHWLGIYRGDGLTLLTRWVERYPD